MNKDLIKPAVLVTSGLVAGGVVGYLIGNKRAKVKYRAIADAEVAEVKEHYKLLRKEGEYADVTEAAQTLVKGEDAENEEDPRISKSELGRLYAEKIAQNGYSSETPSVVIETHEDKVINVFNQPTVKEVELEERDSDIPYVISVDEFMNDDDFDKISITYFEFDNTLIDDAEQMIPDVEGTIGSKSLQRFGHGSNDVEIVYVRNERLRSDFEVARDERSYSEVVLGVKDWHAEDIRSKPRVKKMRDDD